MKVEWKKEMTTANEEVKVRNNPEEGRFEATVNGALCVCEYSLQPGKIIFTHTEVPQEASGRGVANKLAEAGLEHAKRERLRVVPMCEFVASYINRHEQYQTLLDAPE
ncbi:MAG TPA: GNAT family N-acetyltransferase [Thermoanaerobaculia bacterium]|nr:GNAT family N-acetyltransferase [Thermoanaerobaculia bacterium]